MANYRSTTAWKFDERQQYTRGQTSREGRLAPNGTDLRRDVEDRDYPRAITRDNGGVGEITTDTMGANDGKIRVAGKQQPIDRSTAAPETGNGSRGATNSGRGYAQVLLRVLFPCVRSLRRFSTWQFEEPCVDGRKMFNEFIYKLIRLILSVKLNLNFGLTYIISICFWFVIFKRRILGYEEYCIFGFENK